VHADISEEKVLSVALQFVSLGLRDVGYEYVNIDVCLSSTAIYSFSPYRCASQDCWALQDRDSETSEQVPDRSKFPRGMKPLADDIHILGLKIGIYR
jgi:alpha-galactosidase